MSLREPSLSLLLAMVLTCGCAGQGALKTAQERGVGVVVAPLFAGASWTSTGRERILHAVEMDGRAYSFRWRQEPGRSDAFWAMEYCLTHSPIWRSGGLASPPAWTETGLARDEVVRCIASASLPSPIEGEPTKSSVFGIWVAVDSSFADLARGPGMPLWSNGNGSLGAMRRVDGAEARDLDSLRADAQRCADRATSAGVVARDQSVSSSGTDTTIQWTRVSIEGMLGRFDECLRQAGYNLSSSST